MNIIWIALPLTCLIISASLFLYKKTLMDYVGAQHFQVILLFSVTLFIYSLLGLAIFFYQQLIFLLIWLLFMLLLLGFIYYVFKKLHLEHQQNQKNEHQ
ncbi:hypothetical protein WJ437_05720 [Ignavigranum ruoffiae]|uniref:hypothetical protein n=1 Tax=Ignavigranum ruoffiae TaxID=89093 RepID=UPI003AFF6D0A